MISPAPPRDFPSLVVNDNVGCRDKLKYEVST